MHREFIVAVTLLPLLTASTMAQEAVVDTWRFTYQPPADGWQRADFDDSGWKEGSGGFGTRDTPGARVGTRWQSSNIWLRKTFELASVPRKPALLMHHDEDVEVFINGRQVVMLTGYTTEYEVVPLDEQARNALQTGKNVMGVHCRQTGGGQFIDVHLVDAENVPDLPPAKRDTRPFQSELITIWGEKVTPENAWTQYPRPQLVRDNWKTLNGRWDYAVTSIERTETPAEWAGKIVVPFSLESKLGGVQRLLQPNEALWYHRAFDLSPTAQQRTVLNFEAVDYQCTVFVNGTSVGSHQGGHTPFSLDVTDAVRKGSNDLVVRVEDATERWQLRGKQVWEPNGIWYTQVSGIWQTVWLEQVGPSYFADLTITSDAGTGSITLRPEIEGDTTAKSVEMVVKDGDRTVAEGKGSGDAISVTVDDAKLWSPASPHLYNLEVTLRDAAGSIVDRVQSYAGIRTVGKKRDADGHWRFTLNDEEVFHFGPLDQGWWPDGLLTPPADDAMIFEIDFLKSAGFNMIRKHIKVEPRRYYYHCDRLGMMVWQDQVSDGHNPPWTRLQPNPQDADWPEEHHEQYMVELERMIDHLENHPCIVAWVPFNEAWSQHRTVDVGNWVVKRDPTRLVNISSGGNFWPVGDVVDYHSYPHPDFPFDPGRFGDFVMVIGEFGGHGYPVRDHLWDADRRNWGYGGLPQNEAEYKERYATSINLLNDFRRQGIAGGVYTQTTDVEGEINGLMTYDRKVIKISAEDLARLHRKLFEPTR